MKTWPLLLPAMLMTSCRPGEKGPSVVPPRAIAHILPVVEARDAAVDRYIEEKAWEGLTKPQMEYVLRQHGFMGPFRYGPVYEEWWGKGYDEALFFRTRTDDLWILFKNGQVARVGAIYRE